MLNLYYTKMEFLSLVLDPQFIHILILEVCVVYITMILTMIFLFGLMIEGTLVILIKK